MSDQIMVRLVGGALCCVRSMGLQKYLSSWEIATFLLGSEGSFAGVELASGLRIPRLDRRRVANCPNEARMALWRLSHLMKSVDVECQMNAVAWIAHRRALPGGALPARTQGLSCVVPLPRKRLNMRTSRTIKRTALLAAAVMPLSLLAACSSGGSSGEAGSSAQTAKMYAWVSSESDREQWQAFVDIAKEKNPEFSLEFEGPSYNDYFTKVKTRMVASDAPCILTTQAARAQELQGILSPLDELMKANGVEASTYNAAMIKGMTLDGKIVALPYDAEPDVLYYNRQMFKDAGLEEPGTDYSTERFLSDLKALTSDGKYGLAVKPALMDNAPGSLAHSFGGVVSKDGKVTIDEQKFVDGVQFAFDLVAKEGVAVAPNAADGDAPSQGAFTSGKAAMLFDGPWMYSTFEKELGENLGVAVVPNPEGKSIGVIQGSGFGIAQSCPDKEAAFKVLMQLVTPEVIGKVAATRGTVPSISSVVDQWAAGKPEDSVAAINYLLENGTPLVTTPAWNQITTSFIQYSPEGFRGTRTAEDILASIVGSAQ